MTAIGGFFELELPSHGTPYHRDGFALCSGRACLRHILETIKPRHAWIPFFICDAGLIPFTALGIPYTFYPLTTAFEPDLGRSPAPDECLLYVNYFGLKTKCANFLADATRAPVIIDDTQAFFQRGYPRAWSFNSARKFFGVPDGAYAYGVGLTVPAPLPRLEQVRYDHLVNRLLGNQDLAFKQYVENERHVQSDIIGPSILAERLLEGIDYDRVLQTRRRNFAAVHRRLATLNRIAVDLECFAETVPYCYPFLPEPNIAAERLWQRRIFFPRLWPDVEQRNGTAYEWERGLASSLLPLPIDQRYGPEDMNRMCDAVLEEIG